MVYEKLYLIMKNNVDAKKDASNNIIWDNKPLLEMLTSQSIKNGMSLKDWAKAAWPI